jgi:hypothetical protein
MPVRKDRVPPTGPATSAKVIASFDVPAILALSTFAVSVSLPKGSIRLNDSVIVNPVALLPTGILIGGARATGDDLLEVTFGNLGTIETAAFQIGFDVRVNRL